MEFQILHRSNVQILASTVSHCQYNALDTFNSVTKSIFRTQSKIWCVRDAVNTELKGHVRVCESTHAILDTLLVHDSTE